MLIALPFLPAFPHLIPALHLVPEPPVALTTLKYYSLVSSMRGFEMEATQNDTVSPQNPAIISERLTSKWPLPNSVK